MKRLIILLLLLTPGLLLAQVSHGGLSVRGNVGVIGHTEYFAPIDTANLRTYLKWTSYVQGDRFWREEVSGQNLASSTAAGKNPPTKATDSLSIPAAAYQMGVSTPWLVSQATATFVIRTKIVTLSNPSYSVLFGYYDGTRCLTIYGRDTNVGWYQIGDAATTETIADLFTVASPRTKTYTFVVTRAYIKSYVDGVWVETTARTSPLFSAPFITIQAAQDGAYVMVGNFKYFLAYDVAKSDAEILAIHNTLAGYP